MDSLSYSCDSFPSFTPRQSKSRSRPFRKVHLSFSGNLFRMILGAHPPWVPALDVDLVHEALEGDALADVFFAGDPGDGSLDAEVAHGCRGRSFVRRLLLDGNGDSVP